MTSRVEAHIRANIGMVADSDHSFIKYGKVEVGKEMVSHMDITTVVTVERRVHNGVLSATSQDSSDSCFPAFIVARWQLIVLPVALFCLEKQVENFSI